MKSEKRFTVCALLYGDHIDLAKRCLLSIEKNCPTPNSAIADFRIGLNKVCSLTRSFAFQWATRITNKCSCPVILYEPLLELDRPAYKYPTMRRMFFDSQSPTGRYVMWFDDDSYLDTPPADWWQQISHLLEQYEVLGQIWGLKLTAKQWQWIKTQTWSNPHLQKTKNFRFCQGGWWCIQRSVLWKHNWPLPELKHCGGDSLMGELIRHQSLSYKAFDLGVRINADRDGRHSKAPRRGYREPVLGRFYNGTPFSREHQRFAIRRTLLPTS